MGGDRAGLRGGGGAGGEGGVGVGGKNVNTSSGLRLAERTEITPRTLRIQRSSTHNLATGTGTGMQYLESLQPILNCWWFSGVVKYVVTWTRPHVLRPWGKPTHDWVARAFRAIWTGLKSGVGALPK